MAEEADGRVQVEEEHPRGTMAIMFFYLLVIIGLWLWVYLILLARG